MHIDGHNNRVAGRDYYENPTLKLTQEQLAELSIKPCARCETRVVAPGVSMCNHCRREIRDEDNRNKLNLFGFAVFIVWGMLLNYSEKNGGSITPTQLFQLGVAAVGLVILCIAIWVLLRQIWLEHGDDISRLLSERMARFFK